MLSRACFEKSRLMKRDRGRLSTTFISGIAYAIECDVGIRNSSMTNIDWDVGSTEGKVGTRRWLNPSQRDAMSCYELEYALVCAMHSRRQTAMHTKAQLSTLNSQLDGGGAAGWLMKYYNLWEYDRYWWTPPDTDNISKGSIERWHPNRWNMTMTTTTINYLQWWEEDDGDRMNRQKTA